MPCDVMLCYIAWYFAVNCTRASSSVLYRSVILYSVLKYANAVTAIKTVEEIYSVGAIN